MTPPAILAPEDPDPRRLLCPAPQCTGDTQATPHGDMTLCGSYPASCDSPLPFAARLDPAGTTLTEARNMAEAHRGRNKLK